MESKIYALGKRARERLVEEQKKRKTIQVLNENIVVPRKQKKLLTIAATNTPNQAKRRSVAREQQQQQPSYHAISERTIDRVVRLYIHATSKDEDVLLVTPDLIRKFFVGLDEELERIFAIPSYPSIVVPLDDPEAMMQQQQQQNNKCWLRIFVQFTSSTVADLAVQRSKESISWKTGQEQHHCVCIIIHPIPMSSIAPSNILSQRMSIDAIRGEPIFATVQRVHSCLPPIVSNYLVWFMAASLLHLSHYDNNNNNKEKKISAGGATIDSIDTTMNKLSSAELRRVSDHVWGNTTTSDSDTIDSIIGLYNAVWDCHAELEQTCSPLIIVSSITDSTGCTTKMEHPFLRLVVSVSNWLLDELEQLHLQIMQRRCLLLETTN